MQQGWISLHRSLMEHWVYEDKPFCYFGAWVDLILRANHEPKKFVVGDHIAIIERGQLFTSYRSLAERWGWGVKKIKTFLSLLEQDEMITAERTKNGTLLTLVNYGVYQDSGNTKETQKKHVGNTEETPRKHKGNDKETIRERNNNDNNENNENNVTNECVPADASPAPKKKYGTFSKVRLTDDEYSRLCGEYGEPQTKKAIDFLDAYIEEKGYKSKNHNLAIRRWVFDAVKERDIKKDPAGNRQQPQGRFTDFQQRNYSAEDFAALERRKLGLQGGAM